MKLLWIPSFADDPVQIVVYIIYTCMSAPVYRKSSPFHVMWEGVEQCVSFLSSRCQIRCYAQLWDTVPGKVFDGSVKYTFGLIIDYYKTNKYYFSLRRFQGRDWQIGNFDRIMMSYQNLKILHKCLQFRCYHIIRKFFYTHAMSSRGQFLSWNRTSNLIHALFSPISQFRHLIRISK